MFPISLSFRRKRVRGLRPSAHALRRVQTVRKSVDALKSLTDRELADRAADLRSSHADGACQRTKRFALATEAVRRTTGKTYYDVQLLAGDVLAQGRVAEMATGEGKTLVTLLPVIDAVFRGQRVHVATTNAYLAERDFQNLKPALDLLGISSGLLPEDNDKAAKRSAYACDVTYGTGYEFGFDYLRDQLTLRSQRKDALGDAWLRQLSNQQREEPDLVQSTRQAAIVDEIDSVLIDEATTPLVISFFTDRKVNAAPYQAAARSAGRLRADVDYHVTPSAQRISLTTSGLTQSMASLDTQTRGALQRPWQTYVEQALTAAHLLQRDADYVVQNGAIAIVDLHTGRIFPERRYRDGLHQAIELFERVDLTPETNSFARISRQRFFQAYESGTGMTGTARDAAEEFRQCFQLDVVTIPRNRPSQQARFPHRYFCNIDAKYDAIVSDVAARNSGGQPVLIGTRTVEHSRRLSEKLSAAGIEHATLNGLQDADEAAIVARAGACGAVTVATNMAGRGTDITLSEHARQAGGLHVIAAEPNRAQRIDRQLTGRSARQGDPGSCQLFVAADDELLQHFDESLAARIERKANSAGETCVRFDERLRRIQRRAEHADVARRQHLMQQEMWIAGALDALVGAG